LQYRFIYFCGQIFHDFYFWWSFPYPNLPLLFFFFHKIDRVLDNFLDIKISMWINCISGTILDLILSVVRENEMYKVNEESKLYLNWVLVLVYHFCPYPQGLLITYNLCSFFFFWCWARAWYMLLGKCSCLLCILLFYLLYNVSFLFHTFFLLFLSRIPAWAR
jgi:hypothetical protein